VKTNFRTAITIPEKSWGRFRDIFDDYVDKVSIPATLNSGLKKIRTNVYLRTIES
jgi:hypothetical protein